jgi:hypothetical protein
MSRSPTPPKKKTATKKTTTTKPEKPSAKPPSRSFRAVVPAEDESFGVEVPFDVKAVFGKARPPIVVTVAGYTFPSTVAVYGGKPFIGVRRSHRAAAGLKPGQSVSITIALDESTRTVELPPDLASALKKNAPARAAWARLSFTHQREHADALLAAKKPETRARRLEKTIEMLLSKA